MLFTTGNVTKCENECIYACVTGNETEIVSGNETALLSRVAPKKLEVKQFPNMQVTHQFPHSGYLEKCLSQRLDAPTENSDCFVFLF